MNTITAGFLMLLPALITLVVLIGVPVAAGVLLFPYLRGRRLSAARLLNVHDRRSGGDRRRPRRGQRTHRQAAAA